MIVKLTALDHDFVFIRILQLSVADLLGVKTFCNITKIYRQLNYDTGDEMFSYHITNKHHFQFYRKNIRFIKSGERYNGCSLSAIKVSRFYVVLINFSINIGTRFYAFFITHLYTFYTCTFTYTCTYLIYFFIYALYILCP